MRKTITLNFINQKLLTITLIYKKNRLSEIKKLEKLTPLIFQYLKDFAPQDYEALEGAKKQFIKSIEYIEEHKETAFSLHKSITGAWFTFYENKNGIKPKHGQIEGKAISGIKKYLTELTSTEQEALAVWCNILGRWAELDKFTQSKCELTYINAKLNLIIQQLKPSTDDRTI